MAHSSNLAATTPKNDRTPSTMSSLSVTSVSFSASDQGTSYDNSVATGLLSLGMLSGTPEAAAPPCIQTAPNNGVSDGDIQALWITPDTASPTHVTVTLLLKSGLAYSGLSISPSDFDEIASRLHEPDKWSRWQSDGEGGYEVTPLFNADGSEAQAQSKGWTNLDGFAAVPGAAGQTLDADYTHWSATGMTGTGGSVSTDNIAFHADGRYETVRSSIASTGVLQSLNDVQLSVVHSQDASGSWTSTGFTAGSAEGSVDSSGSTVTASMPLLADVIKQSTANPSASSSQAGHYAISSWTIEFTSDDGKVERRLFWQLDQTQDWLNVGTQMYSDIDLADDDPEALAEDRSLNFNVINGSLSEAKSAEVDWALLDSPAESWITVIARGLGSRMGGYAARAASLSARIESLIQSSSEPTSEQSGNAADAWRTSFQSALWVDQALAEQQEALQQLNLIGNAANAGLSSIGQGLKNATEKPEATAAALAQRRAAQEAASAAAAATSAGSDSAGSEPTAGDAQAAAMSSC